MKALFAIWSLGFVALLGALPQENSSIINVTNCTVKKAGKFYSLTVNGTAEVPDGTMIVIAVSRPTKMVAYGVSQTTSAAYNTIARKGKFGETLRLSDDSLPGRYVISAEIKLDLQNPEIRKSLAKRAVAESAYRAETETWIGSLAETVEGTARECKLLLPAIAAITDMIATTKSLVEKKADERTTQKMSQTVMGIYKKFSKMEGETYFPATLEQIRQSSIKSVESLGLIEKAKGEMSSSDNGPKDVRLPDLSSFAGNLSAIFAAEYLMVSLGELGHCKTEIKTKYAERMAKPDKEGWKSDCKKTKEALTQIVAMLKRADIQPYLSKRGKAVEKMESLAKEGLPNLMEKWTAGIDGDKSEKLSAESAECEKAFDADMAELGSLRLP